MILIKTLDIFIYLNLLITINIYRFSPKSTTHSSLNIDFVLLWKSERKKRFLCLEMINIFCFLSYSTYLDQVNKEQMYPISLTCVCVIKFLSSVWKSFYMPFFDVGSVQLVVMPCKYYITHCMTTVIIHFQSNIRSYSSQTSLDFPTDHKCLKGAFCGRKKK